ncbi:MAG: MerR family transcriptional regulator [Sandaracinaceae bacterium]|nr:MerR family transcriptional regulator [Sandaracinaceae bacterium]
MGDLSREFGITLRTLRFYEDKGLISPRRQGQARFYSRRDRARLKLILLGKRVGFSLAGDRRDARPLRSEGRPGDAARVALTKFDEQIAFLEAQRAEIDRALGDLRRAARSCLVC